ncbi:MAG TPA: SWIM zinc finger family protein, partial [Gemmataceae bacterium]|nr:SWIM zinc finger family protein [Gemmataceae bacterium]
MWFSFRPYVPVHVRRAQALREVEKRRKQGQSISPVVLQGRTIARTFWGKAWCENLESYSDYANRLPRGRTYVRNGSVVDLQIQGGKITALVSGSSLYEVTIRITALPDKHWHNIKTRCAGAIGSLVELLQGRLSKHVMDIVTARADGLFPHPDEIKLACSCPDWAGMCKHVAAVLYGVGARLDSQPELLFRLREVDHVELVEEAVPPAGPATATGKKTLAEDELAGVFGIELAETPAPEPSPPARRARSRTKPAAAKTAVGRKRSQAASSLATEAPTAPAPAPSKP